MDWLVQTRARRSAQYISRGYILIAIPCWWLVRWQRARLERGHWIADVGYEQSTASWCQIQLHIASISLSNSRSKNAHPPRKLHTAYHSCRPADLRHGRPDLPDFFHWHDASQLGLLLIFSRQFENSTFSAPPCGCPGRRDAHSRTQRAG